MALNYYSVWPAFACMAMVLALTSIVPWKGLDIPPGARTRVSTLDGLRGFLAYGVFFHHVAIYHRYLLDGVWSVPPSAVFTLFGQAGVAIFFMITGYLFWSRMISEEGRPDWLILYISRIFRIGPLYLVAVGIMLGVVFASTGVQLNNSVFHLLKNLLRWGLLGLTSGGSVNGYENPGRILADVTWTLRYEWWFYLSLPLTALAARNSRMHLIAVSAVLAACLTYLAMRAGTARPALTLVCICLFLQGMCCASLEKSGLALRLPDWVMSTFVVALLVFLFSLFKTAYRAEPVLLLGVVFYLIISGSSVFGLLLTRGARRLGDISYGIYLLQGIVFYFVFAIPIMRTLARGSPESHWIIVFVCGLVLLAFAATTHRFVELPGIRLGKQFAFASRALRSKSKGEQNHLRGHSKESSQTKTT